MPLSTNRLFLPRAAAAASLAAMLAACSGGGSTSLPATAAAGSAGGTLNTQSAAAEAAGTTLSAASPLWKHQCQSERKRCIARVLLISVDGMHGVDLQRFVATHPNSALAKLSRTGVTYADAHAPVPTDSFPGLLALTTGGHPASTGVYYEVSYDRSLYPPKLNCTGVPGTVVKFDESIDIDQTKIDGGGGINSAALTQQLDHGICKPVLPHNYLRVNTIFEAVKAAHRGRTAWSDKEQSYEMLNGPSGHGVDDFYNREIAAGGTTSSLPVTEAYDDTKVAAIINEIDGKSARGVPGVGVPAIFGMNFQAVSVGQKLLHFDGTPGAPRDGYTDASGTPMPALEQAIEHTDASIDLFVDELRKKGLSESTLIVISAKHGQAPINYALRRGIAGAGASFGTLLAADGFAATTTDDLALIWLNHPIANVDDARTKLEELSFKTALGYESGELFTPTNRPSGWGQPSDPRYPDFAVKVDLGVIYTGGTKIAEHGGFSDDDTHVALLVSRAADRDVEDNAVAARRGHVVDERVQTAQVAPTILRALAIDPDKLQAVQQEATQLLPDLDL